MNCSVHETGLVILGWEVSLVRKSGGREHQKSVAAAEFKVNFQLSARSGDPQHHVGEVPCLERGQDDGVEHQTDVLFTL